MWVHSGLSRYIHARPWLLSIFSLSILKPTYIRSTLLHIPNQQCPLLGPTNVEQNTMIREKLYELSFTKDDHLFAIKYNHTYYGYKLTSEGEFRQFEIPFLVDNVAVLLCVCATLLLACYSIWMVNIMTFRIMKILQRQRIIRLEEIRKFAAAKKIIGKHPKEYTKKQENGKKIDTKEITVLEIGIFTAKEKVIPKQDYIENKSQNENSYMGRSQVSFFKAPALYFDYMRRLRANSFRKFLENITENSHFFQGYQLGASDSWKTTSARLDLIDNEYRTFCTKYGFRPLQITEQEHVLKDFKLKIIQRMDENTQAYTRIKWKTSKEKQDKGKKNGKSFSVDNRTSLAKFISSECLRTDYDTDYILIADLKSRYEHYCEQNQINNLQHINIYGSVELEEFGCRLNQDKIVPYISGVAFNTLAENRKGDVLPGLVRIPKDTKSTNACAKGISSAYSSTMQLILYEDGVISNMLIVVFHILMLLVVAAPLFIIVVWSLLQINIINQDIYAQTYSLYNVINPSGYEFWLDHLPFVGIFWAICALSGLVGIFGLIELISFYATDAKNNGKYPIKYTLIKTIFRI